MAVRSISLVDRLELEIQGGLFQNALTFGDVDMDGKNELVVCNGWGHLAIFKGNNSKPWNACSSGLGCVTVVLVGDIQNLQRNVIFCINTEGWCHLFDLEIVKSRKKIEELDIEPEIEEKVSPTKSTKFLQQTAEQIQPTYKQKLRPNPRMAVLEDIDNDGIKELIICYTDRVVKIFKWITDNEDEGLCTSMSDNRGATPKRQPPKDEDRRPNYLLKQSSKDSGKDFFAKSPKLSEIVPPPKKVSIDESLTQTVKGKFSVVQSFSVPGQVGSVSVCKNAAGQMQLMASQPGGGYVILATYGSIGTPEEEQKDSKMTNQQQTEQYGIYYPAAMSNRTRNLLVNTELLGSLRRQGSLSGLSCLCTLDGSFSLVDHENLSLPSLSRATEHTWFTMDTLDVTDDGNDEIVLCSWEGVTYLIDKDNDVMSYNFGENICAFRAGMYAVSSNTNVPCFCYATFTNRIMLYFNVKVDNMKSRCVQDALIDRISNRPEFHTVLQKLKDSDGNINSARIQQFIKETLN